MPKGEFQFEFQLFFSLFLSLSHTRLETLTDIVFPSLSGLLLLHYVVHVLWQTVGSRCLSHGRTKAMF